MKRIFPAEVIEFSLEGHFHRHHSRTSIIYQLVISSLVIGFVSLFFIRVTVSVNGIGILRPASERNTVKSPVNGRIDEVFVQENQFVKAGTVLFTLQADLLERQDGYVEEKQRELGKRIEDLNRLTGIPREELPTLPLTTPLYMQQYNLYRQQLEEAELALTQAQVQYDRQKKLHQNKVIPDMEFEKDVFELEKAESQLRILHDRQVSQWQTELNRLLLESAELTAQKQQLDKERELYTVEAPMDGTIQQFNGAQPGSFMALGETLAEISPDSDLIAEVQVFPRDIGLLRTGMPVLFQIDAFNYNQWGMVKGRVLDISDDVVMGQNNTFFFLVKCELDRHKLTLANGYEGKLKKGMGFQARFQLAERTLSQLLYDKADDWLNPNL
ncbi:HlyD family secretion protein [Algoriphagus sp. AGSA1]|uniref:HlyD family secretion protein n=1 Tax=Algoriphagus sp. AGSA1 TaxID=2907213 RepID=UPI001F263821|nr:HlyD family efflux transporter periplasmic adaptor subunit [Algoriphagus sp. AGSA1]MCE7055208.1 HlyD family secretion protein [Algoriphagus sp. AGSA1]